MNHRIYCLASVLALTACDADLDTTRSTTPRGTIGEVIYAETCQRVAYTSQVDEHNAGTRDLVDVSGQSFADVCLNNGDPPDNPPAQIPALVSVRSLIVAAVNVILPEALLTPLENFLEALVALYDDDTMSDVMKKTATLLNSMASDPGFASAVARTQSRAGYRAPALSGGIAPSVMRYPQLDAMLGTTLDLIHDPGTDGSPAGIANTEFHALLDATSMELQGAAAVASPSAADRTLALAVQLLLTPTLDNGDGTARPAVLRDWRGMAQLDAGVVAPFVDKDGDGLPDIDANGNFVDKNGKKLDIARPFAPLAGDTAKRDAQGRLTDAKGNFIYGYVDLDPSMLAAVLRETPPLLDPAKDTVFGLAWGAGALLGARVPQTRSYTVGGKSVAYKYNGYDTTDSALLDMFYAFVQILGDMNAEDVLTIGKTLLTTYESPTARVIAAMFDANDRGKAHAEATIPATSDIFDELVPIVVRALRVPGLMADLMDAMTDPHVKGLAAMFAAQMTNNTQFILDQNSQAAGGAWTSPVDRTQPDSDYNRSIMQRMAHLIHDANNVKMCNKPGATLGLCGLTVPFVSFDACNLFEIDDLALFYVLSMADPSVTTSSSAKSSRYATTYSKVSFREQLTSGVVQSLMPDSGFTDSILGSSCGTNISGFGRFPTSAALNRVLFIDQSHQSDFINGTMDPTRCSDGDRFIDAHNNTIFGWEKPIPSNPSGFANDSFYDAVRPVVTAFAKHDECLSYNDAGVCVKAQNAAKIFVDMMSLLHEHWASMQSTVGGKQYQSTSPHAPRYSTGDGVVTYEPLIAEILGQADLVPAVLALAPTLNTMTIDGTSSTAKARPVLLSSASYLLDPKAQGSLTYRDGSTSTATMSDGTTPAGHVTPYYLIADAFAKKRAQLAAAPGAQAGSWKGATSTLVDLLFTVDNNNGTRQLHNRHMHGVTIVLVDFIKDRLTAHTQAGDLDMWLSTTLVKNLADTLSGPAPAALIDFTAKLETQPKALTQLYSLLNYLVGGTGDAQFSVLLATTADLLQAMLDDKNLVPIAHSAGAAVDRTNGVVDAQLSLLNRSRAFDPNCPAQGGKQCTLTTVLANLYANRGAKAQPPISDLADSIGEVNRTSPGAGLNVDYTAADYVSILKTTADFLTSESDGFLRFVDIVKCRNGSDGTCPTP